MVVVLVLLMAVVLGAVAVVATGRGGEMSEELPDRRPVRLPPDRFADAHDLDRLRLPVSFRGYRMPEVDAVLDRLTGEIRERDRRLQEMSRQLHGRPAPDGRRPSEHREAGESAEAHRERVRDPQPLDRPLDRQPLDRQPADGSDQ